MPRIETVQIGLRVTHELRQAIDKARAKEAKRKKRKPIPREVILEQWLWAVPAIKRAADESGIEKPERPADGRGRWKRK